MAVTISATFDSADSADLARSRLRSSGVQYADCDVQPIMPDPDPDYDGPSNVVFNPLVPLAGAPSTDNMVTMPGNALMFGGIALPFGLMSTRGIERDIGMDGSLGAVAHEVRMKMRVRNDQAQIAESILTSCHGTKIRRG